MKKMLAVVLTCALTVLSVIPAMAEHVYKTGEEAFEAMDYRQAEQLWQEAAKAGNTEAMFRMGQMYYVAGNMEVAKKWYEFAANEGHERAKDALMGMDMFAKGSEFMLNGEIEAGIPYILEAAELGNVFAMFNAGGYYRMGISVEQSDETAFAWFEKAALWDMPDAHCSLGEMYLHGIGVERNPMEAEKHFLRAAQSGYTDAMLNLGMMYVAGDGVERNEEVGIGWYKLAAEQGAVSELDKLGCQYRDGNSVSQNDELAMICFSLAAEMGYAPAMNNVGYMYEFGLGVEQSSDKAISWYQKAAELNDADALANLGVMYTLGQGVEQNFVNFPFFRYIYHTPP